MLWNIAFDEVAAHDVEWGAQCVDWLSRGMANKCKQAYVRITCSSNNFGSNSRSLTDVCIGISFYMACLSFMS